MRASTLLSIALAALASAALLWGFLGGEGGVGEEASLPLQAERPVPARPGLRVSGTPPPARLRVKPSPAPSSAERERLERLAALWERALVLHGMGRDAQALALLEPVLEGNDAFFRKDDRARALAAIRKGARSVLDAEAAHERLRKLVDELSRWGNLRPAGDVDALEQQLRHAAEVVAQLKNKTERERLLKHLQRFLLPRGLRATASADARRRGTRLDIDGLLDRVQGLQSLEDEPPVPLPIDEPEKVEARRMEQLELLRRRGALSLLDSLHAGLAFLALHQSADGRFADGDALALLTVAHADDPDALRESRMHLSKAHDRYAVPATALALMAFLDFRDQDGRGLFEPTIARAVAWLRTQQAENGLFPTSGRAYYGDAIALMALAQAAGASGDKELKTRVARGLQSLFAVRGPKGGYRYRANQPGDLSAAGWVAQAVEYATLAGIEVPAGMRQGLVDFLDYVWLVGERFTYVSHRGIRRGSGRRSLYPVGMLMGRILWEPDALKTSDARAWSAWLTKGVGRKAPYLYTLYYGVRMDVWMHQKLTTKWHGWLTELSRKQFQTGPLAGGFSRNNGRYLRGFGSLLTTAFALLTMEHALFLR